MTLCRLSASIVTYHSPPGELERLLVSLVRAVEVARESYPAASLQITLIDNAEDPSLDVRALGLEVSRLNALDISITLQQGFGMFTQVIGQHAQGAGGRTQIIQGLLRLVDQA